MCGSTLYGDKGRKRYPTIIYAVITLLNGDCLTRNAGKPAMCNALAVINFKALPRKMTLNIRYGNGAAVVVRTRESLVHGEGRQDINQTINGKVREAL